MTALSVMSGFEQDLKGKILGTHAHGGDRPDRSFTDYREVLAKVERYPGAGGDAVPDQRVMIASPSNLPASSSKASTRRPSAGSRSWRRTRSGARWTTCSTPNSCASSAAARRSIPPRRPDDRALMMLPDSADGGAAIAAWRWRSRSAAGGAISARQSRRLLPLQTSCRAKRRRGNAITRWKAPPGEKPSPEKKPAAPGRKPGAAAGDKQPAPAADSDEPTDEQLAQKFDEEFAAEKRLEHQKPRSFAKILPASSSAASWKNLRVFVGDDVNVVSPDGRHRTHRPHPQGQAVPHRRHLFPACTEYDSSTSTWRSRRQQKFLSPGR